MGSVALPTRRDEAWKWSDLRQAYGAEPPELDPALAQSPVIVQLAAAAAASEKLNLAPGESLMRVERLTAAGQDASSLEIVLGPGASLTRIVFQDAPDVSLNHVQARLAAGSRFRQFVLSLGARFARVETDIEVNGADAEIALYGAYLLGEGRHADFTSLVRHEGAGATTRQLVKGAVRRGGRGVFQGKLFVGRAAQKTDARQHHQGLLLDEGAEIDAKPELEIYADDVACAHGNTVGALDEDALFYIRSRGVPAAAARALLVEAFLREAAPDWLPEAAAAEMERLLGSWLERGA
jgi:Fe-S cluster assembly protein SufD